MCVARGRDGWIEVRREVQTSSRFFQVAGSRIYKGVPDTSNSMLDAFADES
jgi:hypothetical protein